MQSTCTHGRPVCVSTSLSSFPKGHRVASDDNQAPSTVFSPTEPKDSAGSGCYGAFTRPRGVVCKPKLMDLNWGLTGHGGRTLGSSGRAPSHCHSRLFLSCAIRGPSENLSGKQKKEEQLLGHSLLVPVSWQSQELFWLKKKKRLWFTSLINYFYLVLTQSFLWILSIETVAANSVCYSFSGHSNSPSKELSLLTLVGTCLSLDKTTQFSDCRIYLFLWNEFDDCRTCFLNPASTALLIHVFLFSLLWGSHLKATSSATWDRQADRQTHRGMVLAKPIFPHSTWKSVFICCAYLTSWRLQRWHELRKVALFKCYYDYLKGISQC